MKHFLALLTISVSLTSWAGPEQVCFRDTLPFFKNFTHYSSTPQSKARALQDTCRELSQPEMYDAAGIAARLRDRTLSIGSTGLLGGATGAFSSLNDSPAGRRYMSVLNRIKQNPNPMERIRQTYELASIHSGEYDERDNGLPTWLSGWIVGAYRPENLLANARDRGTVGVCREFAALLKWSLQQVSRHPSSRSHALGPMDFSSDFMGSWLPGNGGWSDSFGHAWVRINLPVIQDGRLVDFTRFDLDTTWYPRFTPLFPRRSGLSAANLKRAQIECRRVMQCLYRL